MTKHRILADLILFVMLALGLADHDIAFAGKINIERIGIAQFDLSARTASVKDLNGNDCALVKSFFAISGVQFQGNIIKVNEQNPGEYWVYMTEGSKELRINVPGNLPVAISFPNTEIGAPLSSNVVYEIYGSIDEMSSIMSVSSFNGAMTLRNVLIKNGEYNEAIESLIDLKDSLQNLGISQFIPLVESRINECKRRQVLEMTALEGKGTLSEGMLRIRKSIKGDNDCNYRLVGYMDSVGNIVAQPKYQRGLDFNKGVAWVCKDGRWGCINKKGAVIVPLEYKEAKPIINNHEVDWMKVSADGVHYGIVDYATGREALPMKYEDTSLNESPEDNPLFGLYSPSQKETHFFNKKDCSLEFSIKKQRLNLYLDYGLFITFRKTGMRKDSQGKKHNIGDRGIVDNQGRQVLECENLIQLVPDLENSFDDETDFVKVKCPPRKDWDDWQIPAYRIYSLKDREFLESDEPANRYNEIVGKWKDWLVIGRRHESEYQFENSTYYGLINVETGEKLFDPYSDIECRPYNRWPESVNEGRNLILECTCGKWYLFNNDGSLIELPKNDSGYEYRFFRKGHAILKTNGKYGFVDSNGNVVVTPRFDDADYDYESKSWKVRSGDAIIIIDNLTSLYD